MLEEDDELREWKPSPEVHAATVLIINSILAARISEEKFYRDEEE